MEQKTLAFLEREKLNKGAAKRLRREGKIPAVVYGQGKTAHISVEEREFEKKFSTISENTIIKLTGGKTSFDVLVKDFQDDILTGKIKHIDFYEINTTKILRAHVPVHLTGNAIGIRNGGLMEHSLHEIEVECLPKDLPHEILVDVSALDVGASIHLSEISLPAGVRLLTNGETMVAHVISTKTLNVEAAPSVETAPVAETAAAAPAKGAAPAAKTQEKKA